MSHELYSDSFRKLAGSSATVSYEPLQQLQQNDSYGEGEINLVILHTPRGPHTFVTKTTSPDVYVENEHASSGEQLKKWQDLKNAGVSVPPTFRLNGNSQTLLITDLTMNGSKDIFDPSSYYKQLQYGLNMHIPRWFPRHKESLLDEVVDNSVRAGEAYYLLDPDAFMFTYDPQTDTASAVVADLGRGVRKRGGQVAQANVRSVFNGFEHFGICDDFDVNRALLRAAPAIAA